MATINGTPGNDTLTSTGIGDVLIGGTGNDLYIVNDSADTIVEQGNNGIQGGITLISTDSSGAQGNGDSFNPYFRDDQISGGPYFQFTTPVFSADGTKVIFQSEASNLVSGDTNAAVDIFTKDLLTGVTTRVSTDSSGAQANAGSVMGVFSPDGTKVAFSSIATNLTSGDGNGSADIFIKDLNSGAVTNLTSSLFDSWDPVFSPDGSKIAFLAKDVDFTQTGGPVYSQIYMMDLTTNTLSHVSTYGTPNGRDCRSPVFSTDGSKIAFLSGPDLIVKDLGSGTFSIPTTYTGSTHGTFEDLAFVDHDSKIAFLSDNSTLVPGHGRGVSLYTIDPTTDKIAFVIDNVSQYAYSHDGTQLLFVSSQDNLVPGDINGHADLFLKDLATGEITLISKSQSGDSSSNASFGATFSPDDTQILFASAASNLTSGDTNGHIDIFIKDLKGEVDTVQSSVTFSLSANVENLTLTGSANINGIGNNLNNLIIGNSGDNILNGNSGRDTLVGGLGNDLYVVDSRYDVVRELNGEGVDRIQSLDSYSLGGIFVENLTLVGSANIDATGNYMGNIIVGNSGNNLLNGGAGNDTLSGGAGNDTYIVDSTSDVVTEGLNAGTDIVLASASYTLSANIENLTLTGTSNINGSGNASSNLLIGNSGNNHLYGNNGNDTFDGGSGADTMVGGTGYDVYYVDNTGDVIVEGVDGSTDLVWSKASSYTLSANIEILKLQSVSAALNATGNDSANTLIGNEQSNTLTGGGGNDTLDGGSGYGKDTLIGGTGNDAYIVSGSDDLVVEASGQGTDLVASSGSYALTANVENLTLTGMASISGRGNGLNNVIHGNTGENVLNGAAGNDTLVGGAGTDKFLFNSALNATTNKDLISDFTAGEKILLDHLIFTQAGATGTLLTSTFKAGAGLTSGQDADDRIIYNTTTGNLYYDADGSGSGASIVFAQLGTTTHPSLTATAIQVV